MMCIEHILNLAMAQKIADAAEQKARVKKLTIVIAIMDNHGNLKYFRRMDDTSYGSIRIAQLKATTSASLPFSTRELAERSMKLSNDPYNGGAIPGIILLPGGLPIKCSHGALIGSIGISGATPDLDEECAAAGIAAVAAQL